jgi:PAS domain-containing protein
LSFNVAARVDSIGFANIASSDRKNVKIAGEIGGKTAKNKSKNASESFSVVQETNVVLSPPPQLSGDSTDNWQIAYWVVGILVAIGSPLISAWWTSRSKKAQKAAEDQAARESAEREAIAKHYERESEQQREFYTTLMEEVRALRAENLELKNEIRKCQSEIEKLEQKLEYYERNPANSYARQLFAGIMNALKHPAWVHDIANRRWYLNDAYCRQFGVERSDFWTPINLFGRYKPEDIASYAENDLQVIHSNAPIEFTERVRASVMDPHCDDFVVGRFRKSPVVIGEQPFVFGTLLHIEESEE